MLNYQRVISVDLIEPRKPFHPIRRDRRQVIGVPTRKWLVLLSPHAIHVGGFLDMFDSRLQPISTICIYIYIVYILFDLYIYILYYILLFIYYILYIIL